MTNKINIQTKLLQRFPKKEDTVLQDHWMRNRSDQEINHGPEQSAANSTQLLPYFRIHPQIQVKWDFRNSTDNMLGSNASQPTGFHLRHCWHHVFWLHLFALYWRGRWISHYSEITVLWISVQVSVEYSQIPKIIEYNLSLKTTRHILTIDSHSNIASNQHEVFFRNFFPLTNKINIQTRLFAELYQRRF